MLRLRPPWPDDERAFRAGHEQMAAEDFTFGLELEPDMAWQDYLRRLADSRAGLNLPEGWVISRHPAHPALVSEADFIAAQDASAGRGPAGPAARRYLLAGMVRCGRCG